MQVSEVCKAKVHRHSLKANTPMGRVKLNNLKPGKSPNSQQNKQEEEAPQPTTFTLITYLLSNTYHHIPP